MRVDRHAADVAVAVVVVVPVSVPAVGTETGADHRAPRTTAVVAAETVDRECHTQRSTVRPETQSTAVLWRT